MAAKQEEEQQQQQAKGMPDVLLSSAEMDELNVLHVVSNHEIRGCTNDILNRELLKLSDEMLKFRKVIGARMRADESLEEGDAVQLSRLKPSFDAGWKAWRTSWDDREKEAYDAFIGEMLCDPKSEPENKED